MYDSLSFLIYRLIFKKFYSKLLVGRKKFRIVVKYMYEERKEKFKLPLIGIIVLALIIILVVVLFSVRGCKKDETQSNPEAKRAYGDINGDGKASAADIVKLKKHIAGDIKLEGDDLKAADVNEDGTVDQKDIDALKEYFANLDPEDE